MDSAASIAESKHWGVWVDGTDLVHWVFLSFADRDMQLPCMNLKDLEFRIKDVDKLLTGFFCTLLGLRTSLPSPCFLRRPSFLFCFRRGRESLGWEHWVRVGAFRTNPPSFKMCAWRLLHERRLAAILQLLMAVPFRFWNLTCPRCKAVSLQQTRWFLRGILESRNDVPSAEKIPRTHSVHGVLLRDDLAWLRDRENKVIHSWQTVCLWELVALAANWPR